MVTSQKGIDLIKQFEGCRLEAYLCPAGVPTIGYGHTANVRLGQKITKKQAEEFLKKDLVRYEANVMSFNKIYHWTQNEFDALVSFAYNLGSINGLVNNGKRSRDGIRSEMVTYVKANGVTLPGLVKRRKAELALFNESTTTVNKKTPTYKDLIKELQNAINSEYKKNLIADGVPGPKTLEATPTLSKKTGKNKPKTVKALQKLLTNAGYKCTADGSFGIETEKMVKKYQKEVVKLNNPDGIFTSGNASWKKILKLK